MKKFIIACLASMAILSCSHNYEYETTITYKIYYPGHTVTRVYTHETTKNPTYLLASDRGSNWLTFNYDDGWFAECEKLEDTSAPIEVISFVKVKK